MSELPEPLTPADCDLRGMPFMPVDIVRLFDSDLYALSSGDEFKAAFTLWGKSFLQVPAASLPDDDRILAHLSGSGARWPKLKAIALKGWIRCSDGRLYHPVVAEKAIEAWDFRQKMKERARKGNEKRWGTRGADDVAEGRDGGRDEPVIDAKDGAELVAQGSHKDRTRIAAAIAQGSQQGSQGTGTVKGQEERKKEPPPPAESAPHEPKPKRVTSRTKIPPDWQPSSADENFAVTFVQNIPETASKFRDYHIANGSLMADWPAAWRTWCRNEARFRKPERNQPPVNGFCELLRRDVAAQNAKPPNPVLDFLKLEASHVH